MKAGRELDALVMEKVLGFDPIRDHGFPTDETERHWVYDPDALPRYSEDIAAAWGVHCAMREELFSVRREYGKALQQVLSERLRVEANPPLPVVALIAWPDAVLFLEPVDFCLAALKAKGVEVCGN